MEEKMKAKLAEFEHRIPVTSSNGGFPSNYQQPNSIRHTTPNSYGGAPPQSGRFPLSSSGPNPANYGVNPSAYHPSTFVRPPINCGMNGSGNFYRPPNSITGCYRCGDPMHRVRECPVLSAEQRRPEQLPAPPQQQQPDVRPVKERSNKQDKTCIWVKYRQNKISALIDMGSDVSIAGEDIARNMGWTIHAHRTKEVSVANNDTMSVSGAARVILRVGGCKVETEILIFLDFEGLILGYDWLSQQGSLVWNMPNNLVRIRTGSWTKMHYDEPFVKVRQIFAAEDITVPAHGQVAATAHMLHNAWSCRAPQTQYGVTESQPVSTMEHIYSGRTLLHMKMIELQVLILNARSRDVVFIKGT